MTEDAVKFARERLEGALQDFHAAQSIDVVRYGTTELLAWVTMHKRTTYEPIEYARQVLMECQALWEPAPHDVTCRIGRTKNGAVYVSLHLLPPDGGWPEERPS